ncbi:hypothetical protein C8F04DRAFT_1263824 [Mycena alexandri]|uniref:Uncharacterized protein n=1 Tax=Mycena alexandri TaxID=1745969 RepID=A0AAD6SN58_9AGAR|nr:hypothetical protein C8F04DRAFT_1263824 [Mycena alexandri]
MSSPATQDRCPVPVFHDPGSVGPYAKFYLVTGGDVVVPGAYSSWESAHAEYTKTSSATVKGYTPGKWQNLEAAWHAACGRGEHRTRHATLAAEVPRDSPVGSVTTQQRVTGTLRRGHTALQPTTVAPKPTYASLADTTPDNAVVPLRAHYYRQP